MQVPVKPFYTIGKLHPSLCLQRWSCCHSANSLLSRSAVLSSARDVCEMCHIFNCLMVCTWQTPRGDENLQFHWLQWWRMLPGLEAPGATGRSPLSDEGGWQTASLMCNVKTAGSPCSQSTQNYLCVSSQCLEGQVLIGKTVLLLPLNQSSTSALYGGLLKCTFPSHTTISNPSLRKKIASAAAVQGLDDPAMLSRAAINWKSTKTQSHRGGHILLLCSRRGKCRAENRATSMML